MAKLKELGEFVASKGGNRGKAEFFVGREDELALVENACIQTIRRAMSPIRTERENNPGGILFAGVPGMGKSALLAESTERGQGVRTETADGAAGRGVREAPKIVKKIKEKLGLNHFETPLVINTTPVSLKTEKSLLEMCAEQARALSESATNAALTSGTRMLAEQFTRIDPEAFVNELRIMDVLDRPLVLLMVDEAQSSDENNKGMYTQLHLGKHQLPIVPVFAGLMDSRAAFMRAGISRFARGHYVEMKMLSEDNCGDAMKMFLDRFEIGGMGRKGHRSWERLAVEQSDLFPHHLNTMLIAAAEVALKHGGKLESGSVAETKFAVAARKEAYYKEQAAGFRADERRAAAEIVEEVTENDEELTSVAANALRKLEDPEKNRYGQIDVTGFIRRMEHSGMLQETDDGGYECPIPCFATWLKQKHGKRLPSTAAAATGKASP